MIYIVSEDLLEPKDLPLLDKFRVEFPNDSLTVVPSDLFDKYYRQVWHRRAKEGNTSCVKEFMYHSLCVVEHRDL